MVKSVYYYTNSGCTSWYWPNIKELSVEDQKKKLEEVWKGIDPGQLFYHSVGELGLAGGAALQIKKECKDPKLKEVKRIATKIEGAIRQHLRYLPSIFKGLKVKELTQILDQDDHTLTIEEANLLSDLMQALVLHREQAQNFYLDAAIKRKFLQTLETTTNLFFTFQNNEYNFCYDLSALQEDPADYFPEALIFLFHLRISKDNLFANKDAMKRVVELAEECKGTEFGNFYKNVLVQYCLSPLFEQHATALPFPHEKIGATLHDFIDRLKKDHHRRLEISFYINELIAAPSEWKALSSRYNTVPIHMKDGDLDWTKIAKEIDSYAHSSGAHKHLESLYKACYDKLERYTLRNPTFARPPVTPKEFRDLGDFIDEFQLDLARFNEVEVWRREVEKKRAKVNTKKPPKPTTPPKSQVLATSNMEDEGSSTPPESEIKQPIVDEIDDQFTPPAEVEATKVEPPQQEATSLVSPFNCHDRVTRWFDPKRDPIEEDSTYQQMPTKDPKDAIFRHNFAQAADWVVDKYGFSYQHEGQPALAILCGVKRDGKPEELLRATYTFNQAAEEKKGTLYHRVLTRKKQEELVEEYISLIKASHYDFPPLPSQTSTIPFDESVLGQRFADGSYIEGVKGKVITVRSPIHDIGKGKNKECRLRFFLSV